jgi:hypothetical protein
MIGGPCDAAIWLGKRKKQSVAAVEGGSVPDGGGSPPSSPTPEVAAQGSSEEELRPPPKLPAKRQRRPVDHGPMVSSASGAGFSFAMSRQHKRGHGASSSRGQPLLTVSAAAELRNAGALASTPDDEYDVGAYARPLVGAQAGGRATRRKTVPRECFDPAREAGRPQWSSSGTAAAAAAPPLKPASKNDGAHGVGARIVEELTKYRYQDGDTIAGIAAALRGDPLELLRLNRARRGFGRIASKRKHTLTLTSKLDGCSEQLCGPKARYLMVPAQSASDVRQTYTVDR